MNKTLLYGSLAAVLLMGSGSASALIIDDFGGDVFDQNGPMAGVAAGSSSGGYVRTVDATSSGSVTNVQINTTTNPSVYGHSQSAGVSGTSQINFALGGIDLTEGGTMNAFQISINSIDLNGAFGIAVDGESVALNSNNVIFDNNFMFPSFADILFSDFTTADLTNVSTVSLFIDGSNMAALDATIGLLSTSCSGLSASGGSGVNGTPGLCNPPPPPPPSANVPEPTILALFGLGLVGLGYRHRKNLNA